MTSYTQVFIPLDDPTFEMNVRRIIETSAFCDSSLRAKVVREERHRGRSIFFVRSGKRQVSLTIEDARKPKAGEPFEGKHGKFLIGVDNPGDLAAEKLMQLNIGLTLTGLGFTAKVIFGADFLSPIDAWEKLAYFQEGDDEVEILEVEEGFAPF